MISSLTAYCSRPATGFCGCFVDSSTDIYVQESSGLDVSGLKKRFFGMQELRQALLNSKDEKVGGAAYPMTPIGIVRSCFSTR